MLRIAVHDSPECLFPIRPEVGRISNPSYGVWSARSYLHSSSPLRGRESDGEDQTEPS
jgi:hypothetical protein